jgi:predicted amidophosphoribosyltransferase
MKWWFSKQSEPKTANSAPKPPEIRPFIGGICSKCGQPIETFGVQNCFTGLCWHCQEALANPPKDFAPHESNHHQV